MLRKENVLINKNNKTSRKLYSIWKFSFVWYKNYFLDDLDDLD